MGRSVTVSMDNADRRGSDRRGRPGCPSARAPYTPRPQGPGPQRRVDEHVRHAHTNRPRSVNDDGDQIRLPARGGHRPAVEGVGRTHRRDVDETRRTPRTSTQSSLPPDRRVEQSMAVGVEAITISLQDEAIERESMASAGWRRAIRRVLNNISMPSNSLRPRKPGARASLARRPTSCRCPSRPTPTPSASTGSSSASSTSSATSVHVGVSWRRHSTSNRGLDHGQGPQTEAVAPAAAGPAAEDRPPGSSGVSSPSSSPRHRGAARTRRSARRTHRRP